MMPTEPDVLVSFINMKLRDGFDDFKELCAEYDEDSEQIMARLRSAGYVFDEKTNSFR